jgi:hypothetical protein
MFFWSVADMFQLEILLTSNCSDAELSAAALHPLQRTHWEKEDAS